MGRSEEAEEFLNLTSITTRTENPPTNHKEVIQSGKEMHQRIILSHLKKEKTTTARRDMEVTIPGSTCFK